MKEINPCHARSFSDGFRASLAGLNTLSGIMENGFLWREPEKNLSSPERIGIHSVATVWFSFHWLFCLLRKKWFQNGMVDNSAGSMISSAAGIFLFFLHAIVGRERLVYFIVSYHIVFNLYFIKWIGLNLSSTKYLKSTRDFLHFKDIDSVLWWLFCTFRNSTF